MSGGLYNIGDSDGLSNNRTSSYHLDSTSTNHTLYRNSSTNGGDGDSNVPNISEGFLSNNHDNFLYSVFAFERPVYLYIWEILVILTFFINILVIWVLIQKKMRSVTNLILVAIAISDSMTGLVTLPSYILVYRTSYPGTENADKYEYHYEYNDDYYPDMNSTSMLTDDQTGEVDYYPITLSKSLCQCYMISKYFLSRSFHTVSIWLTLFLGVQRFISVAYPFKTQNWFTTHNTVILCVTIAITAPILHLYHVVNEKAVDGFCSWTLKQGDVGDVFHLWASLLLRHVLPCIVLTITTILFVHHLNNNPIKKRSSTSTRVFSGNEVRVDENRRVSKIVIAIVAVFLITEVPYSVFILFSTIVRHTNANHLSDLKRNRAFHAGYEIALVVSYQMTFYIYTFFNRRFRRQLMKMCNCIRVHTDTLNIFTTSSGRSTADGTISNDSVSNNTDKKDINMRSMGLSSDGSNTDKKLTTFDSTV